MISHKYKCIFIHIPRTAGSSIEKWIHGEDWWEVDKTTKHLLASQAKSIYSEYWDDYFKFAFVRNPWDRMVSCLNYRGFFKVSYGKRMNFKAYKEQFGYPVIVENDYRFYDRTEILLGKHQKGCVYLNILDEELDFIGKYESLEVDTAHIKQKLGITSDFPILIKTEKSKRKNYRSYYDFFTKRTVQQLFAKDIQRFAYKF